MCKKAVRVVLHGQSPAAAESAKRLTKKEENSLRVLSSFLEGAVKIDILCSVVMCFQKLVVRD